jgi:hypothetical protein
MIPSDARCVARRGRDRPPPPMRSHPDTRCTSHPLCQSRKWLTLRVCRMNAEPDVYSAVMPTVEKLEYSAKAGAFVFREKLTLMECVGRLCYTRKLTSSLSSAVCSHPSARSSAPNAWSSMSFVIRLHQPERRSSRPRTRTQIRIF